MPPNNQGKGNIAGAGICNGPSRLNIAAKLPGYRNILRVELYTLQFAIEHTKNNTTNTFIFPNNLNNIYLLLIHLQHLTSHYNHPNKLQITHIIATIKPSSHNITIKKYPSPHKIYYGFWQGGKLSKLIAEKLHIQGNPLPHKGHQTPYWPPYFPHLPNTTAQYTI